MKITYKCLVCGCNVANTYFSRHLKQHNLSTEEYYSFYLRKENEGKCETCERATMFISIYKGFRKFCSHCSFSNGQLSRYKDPEERRKTSKSIKESLSNDDVREHLRKKSKERFSDIKEREKISIAVKNSEKFNNAIKSKEYSENMSKLLHERYSNPANREKMSKSCKESLKFQTSRKTKEFRKRHSEIMSERLKAGKLMVKYRYDNTTFMSLPELAFYVWLKKHKVEFEYQCSPLEYKLHDNIKKYIPDFKVKGQYVEIKGPFFIKEGHLWDPFEKRFLIEKEECMKKHDVFLMTSDKYYIFVEWLEKHFGKEFILQCKIE